MSASHFQQPVVRGNQFMNTQGHTLFNYNLNIPSFSDLPKRTYDPSITSDTLTMSSASTMIDASTVLQNTLTDSNIQKFEDSDKKLLSRMRTQYFDLMGDLLGPTWRYRIESFNVKAGYLASLATVATFLGGVQVSLVAFSATIAASSVVHHIVYFFSYCGLSFNAFGAIFALFTSGSLLSTTSKAKALTSEELDEEVKHQLVAFENLCDKDKGKATAQLQLNEEMRKCFEEFSSSCQRKHDKVKRLAFVIDHHLRDVFEVIWVIIAGVIFFFISLITFIVGTQPSGILVSSISAIGVSALGLLYRQLRRHPGIRRRLKKALGLGLNVKPEQVIAREDHRLHTVQEESSSGGIPRPVFVAEVV